MNPHKRLLELDNEIAPVLNQINKFSRIKSLQRKVFKLRKKFKAILKNQSAERKELVKQIARNNQH